MHPVPNMRDGVSGMNLRAATDTGARKNCTRDDTRTIHTYIQVYVSGKQSMMREDKTTLDCTHTLLSPDVISRYLARHSRITSHKPIYKRCCLSFILSSPLEVSFGPVMFAVSELDPPGVA